jgi:hypothetical protein
MGATAVGAHSSTLGPSDLPRTFKVTGLGPLLRDLVQSAT